MFLTHQFHHHTLRSQFSQQQTQFRSQPHTNPSRSHKPVKPYLQPKTTPPFPFESRRRSLEPRWRLLEEAQRRRRRRHCHEMKSSPFF